MSFISSHTPDSTADGVLATADLRDALHRVGSFHLNQHSWDVLDYEVFNRLVVESGSSASASVSSAATRVAGAPRAVAVAAAGAPPAAAVAAASAPPAAADPGLAGRLMDHLRDLRARLSSLRKQVDKYKKRANRWKRKGCRVHRKVFFSEKGIAEEGFCQTVQEADENIQDC